MRKDRDVLVPAVKCSYLLSYATDGSRLLQIGSAPICHLLQTLFAHCRQSLIIYIYIYTFIHMYICIYIYRYICILEIIFDLPFGFPINNIISLYMFIYI